MSQINSHLHVPRGVDPDRISPVMVGPDPNELYAAIKPVRYRYVLTYLHNDGTHQAGELIATLPLTEVTYGVGMYAGTELTGNVYLPEMTLDQMPHPPFNDFDRRVHPDQQGVALGSMFECGNRAVYVMRNEKVVWGGILWSRSYTSGAPTLGITALSWEGYAYYRLMRLSVSFPKAINVYTIWYAVLKALLTDFNWRGKNHGIGRNDAKTVIRYRKKPPFPAGHPHHGDEGKIKRKIYWNWTGIGRGANPNANPRNFYEQWPYNSPDIELPPADLLWRNSAGAQVQAKKTWRGYDMGTIGERLQEWADTETLATVGAGHRFEYRVVCWFDKTHQRFRQRYVFGNMEYEAGKGLTSNDPTPKKILSPFLGTNTKAMARSEENDLVYDFPGHISSWSLNEVMDQAATRVITINSADKAAKRVAYAHDKLLDVPKSGASRSREGWRLYDQIATYDTKKRTVLRDRATRLLQISHVPEAEQISDLAKPVDPADQRSSYRSTLLTVTLYHDPTATFHEFELGDWVTFAIEDPFYGGKMYLVRRIIGYTVTVVPDHESEYSHEQIVLELTDDTQVDIG